MDREIQVSYLKDLIYDVRECLDELNDEKRDDLNDGQRLAFTHILRTIQPWIDETELKDFGLDFDIDRKYS